MPDVNVTFLGNKYSVSPFRVVDLTTLKELEILTFSCGEPATLVLDCGGKKIKVNYGLFLLYSYELFSLPFELWDNVRVGFINGDKKDFSLSNLYPDYFNGPLEDMNKKGFYFIPGLEYNVINKEGVVHRILRGDSVTPRIYENPKFTNKVFPTVSVHLGYDKFASRPVSRLLAITFLSTGLVYPVLRVVALDNDRENYKLDNLKLLTASEEGQRVTELGSREEAIGVLVLDTDTGVETKYPSVSSAGKQLNIPKSTISRIISGGRYVYGKRYLIKKSDDEKTWDELERMFIRK